MSAEKCKWGFRRRTSLLFPVCRRIEKRKSNHEDPHA